MTIRVLHVLNEIHRSGVEIMLLSAVEAWRALNVEIGLVATGPTVGSNTEPFARLGVPIHHVPYRTRPSYLLDLCRVARPAYDVVQFHTERAFIYSELACRAAGAAVVHAPCSYIRIGGSWRIRRIVHRRLARAAGVTTVAIGRGIAANEREWFRNPTVLVPNFIDTGVFRPGRDPELRDRLGLPRHSTVLMVVGNCLPVKNHGALLEALAVAMASPASATSLGDWHLLHVGVERDDSERRQAERLGLADRCHFLGPRDDVPRLLRAADVFVMPSLSEGLSIAAIEAAATGLVLLASNRPGLSDLHDEVALGRWVAPDAEHLGAALPDVVELARAATDHDRAEQHARVRAVYGIDVGTEAYAALYRRLVTHR